MVQVKKILAVKIALVLCLLMGSCESYRVSEGVGEYLLYSELRLKEKDFEIILKVTHVENDRYSFKEWYGDKLVKDDIFLIKKNLVYDLTETKKVGEYSDDFRKYSKRSKIYNRLD